MGDSRALLTPQQYKHLTHSMTRVCARRMQRRKHVLTSNLQMGKLGLKDGGTYPKRLYPYTVGAVATPRQPGGRGQTLVFLGSAGTCV